MGEGRSKGDSQVFTVSEQLSNHLIISMGRYRGILQSLFKQYYHQAGNCAKTSSHAQWIYLVAFYKT